MPEAMNAQVRGHGKTQVGAPDRAPEPVGDRHGRVGVRTEAEIAADRAGVYAQFLGPGVTLVITICEDGVTWFSGQGQPVAQRRRAS
jgi:hypothetical protein